MLPVIAHNLLRASTCWRTRHAAGRSAIAGFRQHPVIARHARAQPDPGDGAQSRDRLREGCGDREKGRAEGRPVREVAAEMTGLDEQTLSRLLDPTDLTRGGVRQGGGSGEPS